MKRFRVSEDIRPMSEFRAGMASFLKLIRQVMTLLLIISMYYVIIYACES